MRMLARHVVTAYAALAVCATLLAFPSAAAAELKFEPLPGQENGMLTVSPNRWDRDVQPGQTTTFRATVINRTGADAVIRLKATDTAPGDADEATINPVDDFQFGAGSWIRPEVQQFNLDNMQEASFDVSVTPPLNAPVGDNFAGLLVELIPRKKGQSATAVIGGDEGGQVSVAVSGLIQIYPRIAGEIEHQLRIRKAEVADKFVFTGNRYVVYEIEVENTGNVNEPVTGEAVVRSMFGNTVANVAMNDMIVLRGAKRRARMLWTNPPKFGRFSAEARLAAHQDLREPFPTVVILPPWWWFAILAATIGFGVAVMWYRRRQSWKQYLDDEEWDDVEDWDIA